MKEVHDAIEAGASCLPWAVGVHLLPLSSVKTIWLKKKVPREFNDTERVKKKGRSSNELGERRQGECGLRTAVASCGSAGRRSQMVPWALLEIQLVVLKADSDFGKRVESSGYHLTV